MQSSSNQSQTFSEIRIDGQGNQLVVNQIIQISRDEVRAQKLNPTSPYLALERFDEKDARLFFGRDRLIGELLAQVKDSGFTLVAGASGSGKSSLVRAGLMPQLHARLGPRLRVLAITPEDDPFESLRPLLRQLYRSPQQREQLRGGEPSAETLLSWARTLRGPSDLWLLILDQFEEIFTRTADAALRSAFLDGVVRLVAAQLPDVRIVATMRADFMDQLGRYPELARLAQKNLLLVTDMTPDELRPAIEQPAAQHGVVFAPGLVEQIVTDVEGEAGALPLLQYTLDLFWRAEKLQPDKELKDATYREIGGVRGALEKRAQVLFSFRDSERQTPRPQPEQEQIRNIFLRLVDFKGTGDKARAVSRPAKLASFQSPSARSLIEEFVDAKLLVTGREKHRRNQTDEDVPAMVEVAHEALLTAWGQLAAWIEQGREVITLRNRLAVDAAQWQRTVANDPARAEEDLWSGTHLQSALERDARGEFRALFGGLEQHEQAFLQASRVLSERREDEREERRLRRIQALQRELDGFIERGRLLLLAGQPMEAAAWLVGAYERGAQHPMLPYLLRQAMLHVERVRAVLLGHTGPVRTIAYSRDGRRLVTASQDGTARVWDVQTGAPIAEMRGHAGPLNGASLDSRGERVLTFSADGTARIWQADSGALVHTLGGHGGAVTAAAFHPAGRMILSAAEDALVRIWDAESGQLVKELRGHSAPIRCACYSPDGTLILSAGDDGVARLWDARSGGLEAALEGSGSAISCAGFSPDGSQIVAVAEDRSIRFWHTQVRIPRLRFGNHPREDDHEGRIHAYAFSPAGSQLATASEDGTAGLWTLSRLEYANISEPVLTGHDSSVTSVAFGPEGRRLCTASEDGTVRLWDVVTRRCLDILQGPTKGVTQVQFSPDGRQLAACSADGTAWLWTVASPLLCAELGRPTDEIQGFKLSSDQRLLASWGKAASARSLVRIWEPASGRCLQAIELGESDIETVQFSRDGSLFMIAASDGTVTTFDSVEFKMIGAYKCESRLIRAELSPDGSQLLTLSEKEGLQVWAVATSRPIQTLEPASASLKWACFAPSGAHIATASERGRIKLTHQNLGKEPTTLRPPTAGRNDIIFTFSADGSRLLAHNSVVSRRDTAPSPFSLWMAGEVPRRISSAILPECNKVRLDPTGQAMSCVQPGSDTILIFDTETWLLRSKLAGHGKSVRDVLFSPDGARIASSCDDDCIRIFEVGSGALLSRYEIYESSQLLFSADGQQLFAKCDNATLCILDVGTVSRTAIELAELLRARVPYRLNGTTLAQTKLEVRQGGSRKPSAAELRYSDRRDDLLRMVYMLSNGNVEDTHALWTSSSAIIAWFEDVVATAMQEIVGLAIDRRMGRVVDETLIANRIIQRLEQEFPPQKGLVDALCKAAHLAAYLDEPGLAVSIYEACLRWTSGSELTRVQTLRLAAQLQAGLYESVHVAVTSLVGLDETDRQPEALVMVGWIAAILQRGTITVDRLAIYNIQNFDSGGWGFYSPREMILSLRKAVFRSKLSQEIIAQLMPVLDSLREDKDYYNNEQRDLIISILECRTFVLQKIASGDFNDILVDAEIRWPHLLELHREKLLLWATLYWCLALQVEDPNLRNNWTNRICEIFDTTGYSLNLPNNNWFIPALSKFNPPLRHWNTICRVLDILSNYIKKDDDNWPELFDLLNTKPS